MTQVLWQKSKRKVMNENQVLRAFFWVKDLRQNDYLIKSVHKWTYLGRKHNKFSQPAALGFKVGQHNIVQAVHATSFPCCSV